jgi:hypothetical protein
LKGLCFSDLSTSRVKFVLSLDSDIYLVQFGFGVLHEVLISFCNRLNALCPIVVAPTSVKSHLVSKWATIGVATVSGGGSQEADV